MILSSHFGSSRFAWLSVLAIAVSGTPLLVEAQLHTTSQIEEVYDWNLDHSLSARQATNLQGNETGGGFMTSHWNEGTVSNLKFVAIDKTVNGTIELTIAWPTNGLSTNTVDIFACTNPLSQDWKIAATTNINVHTNTFSWVDENSTNNMLQFYDCWTLHDTDRDGISDGREIRLLGTDESNWNTDGDGIRNGTEPATFETDPLITHHNWLPYSTGFENTNGYIVGMLNGQNGWESYPGATVQAGIVHTGGQSIELESLEATMTKYLATTNNSVTVKMFVYLGEQFSAPTNLPSTGSSLVTFEAGIGIRAYDGNGIGDGSWTTASGTISLLNQWVELEIVQDYSAKTWRLSVDGSLKLSSLGFKDNGITHLDAMHVRSGIGSAVICDDVTLQ